MLFDVDVKMLVLGDDRSAGSRCDNDMLVMDVVMQVVGGGCDNDAWW